MLLSIHFIFDSAACAIPDSDNDEVIITGGSEMISNRMLARVSVYRKAGHSRDLADMRNGRGGHACSSFISNGKRVIIERLFITSSLLLFIVSCYWSPEDRVLEILVIIKTWQSKTQPRSTVTESGELFMLN